MTMEAFASTGAEAVAVTVTLIIPNGNGYL